jgi:hypothetical protein
MACKTKKNFFCVFFGGLECDGHSLAHAAHFVFLRDVWIRTQRAAVACRCATNLYTHLPKKNCFEKKNATHGLYLKT